MTAEPGAGDFGPILPRHVAMLLTLAAVWGTSFMAIKVGVGYMSALDLTAIRLAVAAAAMILVAVLFRSPPPLAWRALGACFVLALFGNSLPFFLISWGEEGIDSGRAAILIAVMPLATLVLAHFFADGDRMRPRKLLGVLLGFGGIVVLVGPAAFAGLDGKVVHQLAVAGGALCYAVSVILLRRMPASPLVGRAATVLVFSVLQTVPVAWLLADAAPIEISWRALWPAVYLGLFPTALATLVLFRLAREREPSFIAFQNYLVPLFGVFWGWALLNETVSVQALAALALILAGIFFANRRLQP